MNRQHDVAELKAFARLHGRAQNLDERLLDFALYNIDNDRCGDKQSWAKVLVTLAERAVIDGDLPTAVQLFNLARFPYAGDPVRQQALKRCQHIYREWLTQEVPDAEYWRFSSPGFGCYATGLDSNKPVVIVLGGIVSIKEQWHRLLRMAKKLGYCVVVTELPGVGENGLPYDASDSQLFRRIVRRLNGRANTDCVKVIGFSFGGHLAMNAALTMPAIKSITTVGAPVSGFFSQAVDTLPVPDITYDTLAHILGCERDVVKPTLSGWGLTPSALGQLQAKVNYLASSRDEIIPLSDMEAIRANVPRNQILKVDDIHGAPNHLPLTAAWIASDLVKGSKLSWLSGLTDTLVRRKGRKAGAEWAHRNTAIQVG